MQSLKNFFSTNRPSPSTVGPSLYLDGTSYPLSPAPPLYGPGVWRIDGTGIHLTEKGQDFAWKDGAYHIRDEGVPLLKAMIAGWRSATPATLYRGFSLWHRCIPRLLQRSLHSEGDSDVPTFTMTSGDEPGTRWLPFTDIELMARGIATGGVDLQTRRRSSLLPLPLGVVVSFRVHHTSNADVCWINAGEIVVRGPLRHGQFAMHTLCWMEHELDTYAQWPRMEANADLVPPQRPMFNELRPQDVDDWLNNPALFEWLVHAEMGGSLLAGRAVKAIAEHAPFVTPGSRPGSPAP